MVHIKTNNTIESRGASAGLNLPPLSFINDCAGMSKCGRESIALNIKTEEFMKSKKLTLSEDKCHVLHIGKRKHCVNQTINGTKMEKVENEKY